MEPLLHVANVFFLFSYAARDVLWLRILTFFGLGVLVGLQWTTAAVDAIPIYWNVAFMAINGLHIGVLLWQRRPLTMTPEEAHLRRLVFSALTDRQFAALTAIAHWADVYSGEGILAEGDSSGRILVLTHGRAIIAKGGVPLADVGPGDFVGEISFLTGEVTTAAVIALEAASCAWWSGEDLHQLLESDPQLGAVVKGILGVDVAIKLRSSSAAAAPTDGDAYRSRSISLMFAGS